MTAFRGLRSGYFLALRASVPTEEKKNRQQTTVIASLMCTFTIFPA